MGLAIAGLGQGSEGWIVTSTEGEWWAAQDSNL